MNDRGGIKEKWAQKSDCQARCNVETPAHTKWHEEDEKPAACQANKIEMKLELR